MSKDIEERNASELRASLYELGDQLRGMREKSEDARSESWSRELRDTAHLVYGLDAELRIAELRESAERAEVLEARRSGAGSQGLGVSSAERAETRSIGQQLVENTQYQEWASRNRGNGTSPDIEVRTLISEGAYGDTTGGGLWVPRGTPYLPASAVDRRRLFVRDVIANGTTSLQAIPYIRETNPRVYEGGATSVAEGATFPEVSVLFSQDLAPVRKIGAWVPVTTEILEDAPTLSSYINGRLGYMLQVREEEQILNGTGNGADIRGITNTPNVQTQSAVSGDFAATIGAAIAKIEAVDGDADALAMNPLDYWTMVTSRHATRFDGEMFNDGSGAPFGQAPTTVWGLPAVRSRSIAQGSCLVGAWKTGAQMFDRSSAVIRVGDQHADYFTNNKVAILIEERIALAVYRPDWFVIATLA